MPIRVLPPDLAGQIAAGEVVERPASVVKELVENALDAGASQVIVELAGGGLRLIRVVDDGVGIPEDEVEVAFLRHATSKLSTADDLHQIGTLGFRGEALPSIAAVAQVTMLTRTPDRPVGSFLSLRESQVVERGARACPPGTTVTVRGLFANVPARFKFLRSTATEVGQVSQIITQFALAYPEVRFELLVDGRSTFRSTGRGDRRAALAEVYGVDVARSMLPVVGGEAGPAEAGPALRLSGFASPPSVNRVGRLYLTFLVNRRPVQNRTLLRAVEDAYGGLLPVGRHPIVVLDLTVPPEEVDVNVHPAKREVKFAREQAVYTAVHRSMRDALAASSPVVTFAGQPEAPAPTTWTPAAAASFNFSFPEGPSPAPSIPAAAGPAEVSAEGPVQPVDGRLPILRVVGQVGGTYVVAEGPEGMYLIDQHTAHERILYEQLLAQCQERAVEVQGLLEPLVVEVAPSQAAILADRVGDLGDLGFVVEAFGERAYLVRAVPAFLRGSNLGEAFTRLVDALGGEGAPGEWRERACLTLACHGAVRAGQSLSMEEMRELVRRLERTDLPHTCPHGRPILVLLSAATLEKGFGRR